MCIGGRLGAEIDIDGTGKSSVWARLWGESLGRFLVGVQPEQESEFIQWMSGHPLTYLGEVTKTPTLIISDGYDKLVETGTNVMVESWQKTLDMTGGVV